VVRRIWIKLAIGLALSTAIGFFTFVPRARPMWLILTAIVAAAWTVSEVRKYRSTPPEERNVRTGEPWTWKSVVAAIVSVTISIGTLLVYPPAFFVWLGLSLLYGVWMMWREFTRTGEMSPGLLAIIDSISSRG
jgi:hypothetical protein